jgi:hypothetical protein
MLLALELRGTVFWQHTVLVKKYNIATGKVDGVSSAETGDCEFIVSLNAICFNPGLMPTYGRRRRRLREEPYWGYLKANVNEERKRVV